MHTSEARLAQPAERKALNLVVVGSNPTVGVQALGAHWGGGPGPLCAMAMLLH